MSNLNIMRSKPEEVPVNSGVSRHDRAALAKCLSKALANTYMLYLKTQNVHWNVVGPMFYSIHKLTEEQYEDMAEAIDEIAERIRSIGFVAPGSFRQFQALTEVEESAEPQDTNTMISELIRDNELCSRQLRIAVEEAEIVEDVKTAGLLTDRIGQHEENAWMLKASIS